MAAQQIRQTDDDSLRLEAGAKKRMLPVLRHTVADHTNQGSPVWRITTDETMRRNPSLIFIFNGREPRGCEHSEIP